MPESSHPFTTLRTGDASRRALLRGAGLAAVAVGIGAGCTTTDAPETGSGPSGAASTPGAATPGAPTSSSSPTGSGSSSPPPSASEETSEARPPEGIVVAAADVPEGGGVVIQEKYVVTQPSAGEYKAFSAVCTHQGCPVEKVENSEIICPCHGSRFAIDSGDPVAGPADQPLPPVEFTKSGDDLVLPE